MQGCAVIRALTEKAFATAHLVHIERHVLNAYLDISTTGDALFYTQSLARVQITKPK